MQAEVATTKDLIQNVETVTDNIPINTSELLLSISNNTICSPV